MTKRSKRKFFEGRPVIGPVEEVKIWNGGSQKHEVLSRIDSGADYSSIAEKLAIKIGFKKIVKRMRKLEDILHHPIKNSMGEKRMLMEIKGVEKSVLIRSASGYTRRPMVKIKMKIAGKVIKTLATIIKRTNMQYQMIVGRNDLKKGKFIIDPKRHR